MSSTNGEAHARVVALSAPSAPAKSVLTASFEDWRCGLRQAVQTEVADFISMRCAGDLHGAGVDVAADVLQGFVGGGKCVRSSFVYLGWLCGANDDSRALRAAASFELLHAFALLQDDVMDDSALRRGRPAGHVAFARWHSQRMLSGSAQRFGDAAAVLLGDLCLVWAEQMLRESGLATSILSRAWPRYDAMRSELAAGQFADLVNDAAVYPTWEQVLDVLRRKSGNYTVRRPLEIGAALADCGQHTLALLGSYGEAIGEAFQLRDDVLGIFGSPAVTGKPTGSDLSEHKATSIVVAACRLADPAQRDELTELMSTRDLDESDIHRWRSLIAATGALEWIEQLIDARLDRALKLVDAGPITATMRTALAAMATACTERAA